MVFLRSIFGLVSLAVLSGCQMGSPRTPASNDLSGMLAELNHQSDSDGLGSTGAVRPYSRFVRIFSAGEVRYETRWDGASSGDQGSLGQITPAQLSQLQTDLGALKTYTATPLPSGFPGPTLYIDVVRSFESPSDSTGSGGLKIFDSRVDSIDNNPNSPANRTNTLLQNWLPQIPKDCRYEGC